MQIIRSAGTRLFTLGILSWSAMLPAHAHFLWASIVPGAKPTLQIRFTEVPQEKTLPALLPKLHPNRTWSAEKPAGATEPATVALAGSTRHLSLLTGDGVRQAALTSGTRLAATEQVWGVLDKAKEGRGVFLLKYYAKAAGDAEAAQGTAGLPVEIVVSQSGTKYTATVLNQGKPVADAEVIVITPTTPNGSARKTDAKGKVEFTNEDSGLIGIRAMVAENTKGDYEGKAYELVRHYSTLTFPTPNQPRLANAETEKSSNAKADPAAFALLKGAHDRRYVMPRTVGEVSGKVSLNDNGKMVAGEFTYSAKEGVTVKAEGGSSGSEEWLRGQISNIFGHRRGGEFAKTADGMQPLTFSGVEDESPLGRQINLNDGMKSFYRVKDRTVTEVTRTMGDARFTITVLDVDTVEGGKYLPRHFVVTYFDAKTGQLRRTESFTDAYVQTGDIWLPASRRVVTAENGTNVVRILELSNVTTSVKTASR